MKQTGLILAAFLLCLPLHAAPKKPPIDKQIAHYAAIIGTNRLAKDIEDSQARVWIGLASVLWPENNTMLLTKGLIARGKTPAPIATKVTESKLLEVLLNRAEHLRLKVLPENKGAGDLSLLYYRVAEQFLPAEPKVILGLGKLELKGYAAKLDNLLKAQISLAAPAEPAASKSAPPTAKRDKKLPAKGQPRPPKKAKQKWDLKKLANIECAISRKYKARHKVEVDRVRRGTPLLTDRNYGFTVVDKKFGFAKFLKLPHGVYMPIKITVTKSGTIALVLWSGGHAPTHEANGWEKTDVEVRVSSDHHPCVVARVVKKGEVIELAGGRKWNPVPVARTIRIKLEK